METFYYDEVDEFGRVVISPTPYRATNLLDAKKKAQRTRYYRDTALRIGTGVNEYGRLLNLICYRMEGTWENVL